MAPQREWFEKDYYATLGVPQGADQKTIAKAYRKLAREHHPDANPGNADAEEKFKEISAAYDVIGDAEKRKEYDEVRRMAASGFGGGAGRFNFTDFGGDFGDLDDILGTFLGGGRGGRGGRPGARQPRAARGADLEAELSLSFDDAMRGTTTSVAVDADRSCSVCHGTGAEPGSAPRPCTDCRGSGTVAVDQGPFSFSQPCPTCRGAGQIIERPCQRCGGRGVERARQDVKVRIPAGAVDGERIKVPARGAHGMRGGPRGDLWVRVHVPGHPLFERRGRYDLGIRVPVTHTEATLGADVKVPTLEDPVTVRIPPGTPSGRTLRVKGRGAHKPKGGRGDLMATVDVVVPQKVSKEERDLLEQLAALQTENPRRHFEV
ncbi:MAG TPA: J domain-containing protein [Acidimicrobiia bacterium]|nr:J domain-containing protein [Acidimicrobiia bacterium]